MNLNTQCECHWLGGMCRVFSESWVVYFVKGLRCKGREQGGPESHNCPQFRTLGVTPSSQLRPSLRELRAELSANDTMVNWQKHNKFYQLNGKGFRKPTSNVWLLPRYKRPFLDFPNMLTPKDKRLIEVIWQPLIKIPAQLYPMSCPGWKLKAWDSLLSRVVGKQLSE